MENEKYNEYCKNVRIKLNDKNTTLEQVKDLFERFVAFSQGYLDANDIIMIDLKTNLKDYKARFDYLLGKNVCYATGINELKTSVLNDVKAEYMGVANSLQDSDEATNLILKNIFTLIGERLSRKIEKNFFDYLNNGKKIENEKLEQVGCDYEK